MPTPPTSERADRAVLTVDLGALAENYRRLCREAASAEVAGVVKADGYGLGAAEVASALRAAGCRRFFVAMADEGVALRAALPGAEIAVLDGPASGAEDAFLAHNLVPVVNAPEQLALWAATARRLGRRLRAWLHLDTGMCRLGIDAQDVADLDGEALAALEVVGVMSHLACADEPEHPLNAGQLARLDRLRRLLPAAPASLANSAGIFLGPGYHLDLCRPGIALYGANPIPGRPNPMAPVVTLEAPVLQVHSVPAGGTVGYGATYRLQQGGRIAALPLGYADGMLRAAGNRASLRIGAHAVPIAGRISMDLMTIDVSELPEGVVRPGSWVEVIGGVDGLDRYAEAAGTIPYELLTRLGRRFVRRYQGGNGA